MNNGRFILNHRDHGFRLGWGDPYFDSNNVQNLNNGNYWPTVFSINCETGWFDQETDGDSGTTTESFCEEWVRLDPGGAACVFGATRVSYSGYNDYMARGFYDAIWPGFDTGYGGSTPIYRMGEVMNYGKTYMINYWSGSLNQLEFEIFHCFGDPTQEIWTQQPSALTVSHPPSAPFGATQVVVDVAETGALICISQDGRIMGRATAAPVKGPTVVNTLPLGSGTYNVTVTLSNNLPYRSNFTVPLGDHELLWDQPRFPANGEAGQQYSFSATLVNDGLYDETNIEVQFLVDGIVNQTQTVPFLSSQNQTIIAFYWTPMFAGNYNISMHALPVPDENVTWNNWVNGTFTVTADPNIWINPSGFDFALEIGQTDADILAIGNDGLETLDYQISLGKGDPRIGLDMRSGTPAYQTHLNNLGYPYIDIQTPTDANWLYENVDIAIIDGWGSDLSHTDIDNYSVFLDMGGSIWLSYDDISDLATGTQYIYEYIFGAHQFNETPDAINDLIIFDATQFPNGYTTYLDPGDTINLSQGDQEDVYADSAVYLDEPNSGHYATINDLGNHFALYLGDTVESVSTTANSTLERLLKGFLEMWEGINAQCDWLEVIPDNGLLAPYEQRLHDVLVNTSTLSPGYFTTNITILSNDPDEGFIQIPVNLTVLAGQHDLRVLDIDAPENGDVGQFIEVNGTILNQGISDESDIIVEFWVEGSMADDTMIAFLGSGNTTDVNFGFVPMTSGDKFVQIISQPVTGESFLDNNELNATINVTAHPEIWVSPTEFDFILEMDDTANDTLTIGNNGMAGLQYELSDHQVDEPDGFEPQVDAPMKVGIFDHNNESDISYWNGGMNNNYQTYYDILMNTTGVTPYIIDELSFGTIDGLDLDVLILPDNAVPDIYLDDVDDWFGPGRIIICGDSAVCYACFSGYMWPAGAGIGGYGTYWNYDSQDNNMEVMLAEGITEGYTVGEILPSAGGDAQMYDWMLPPNAKMYTRDQFNTTSIYIASREVEDHGTIIVLGPFDWDTIPGEIHNIVKQSVQMDQGEDCPWLTEVPDAGSISPSDSDNVTVTVDTTGLNPGEYHAIIEVESNDPDEPIIEIPVNLTVLAADHDIKVGSINTSGDEPTRPVFVNGTILNQGLNDEGNIEVQLLVNGSLEDIIFIPFLGSGAWENVSLSWTPMFEGIYYVEINALPVAGETIIWNNILGDNVTIIGKPDIWYDPHGFDFIVDWGDWDSDNLTVGNDGTGQLDYEIHTGSGIQSSGEDHPLPADPRGFISFHDVYSYYWNDGNWDAFDGYVYTQVWVGGNTQGNVLISNGTHSYMIDGYEFEVVSDWPDWNVLRLRVNPLNDADRDDITVEVSGNLGSDGSTQSFWQSFDFNGHNIDYLVTNDGSLDSLSNDPQIHHFIIPSRLDDLDKQDYSISGDNPTLRLDNVALPVTIYVSPSEVGHEQVAEWVKEDLEFAGGADWINVTPENGSLLPGSQTEHVVRVDSIALLPGYYQDQFSIESNDPDESEVSVPVNLTVLYPENDLVVEKRFWDDETGTWEDFVQGIQWDTERINISVFNSGTEDILDINIVDYLPNGISYNGNPTVNGIYHPPDNVTDSKVTWNLSAPLAASESLYIEFDVILEQLGFWTNWAVVSGLFPVGGELYNLNNATINVLSLPTNVTIEKEVSYWGYWQESNYTYIGDIAQFRMAVTNTGIDTIWDCLVNDTIPSGMSFYDCSPMYTSFVGNELMWLIPGPFYPNGTVYIYLNLTVDEYGYHNNWAYVWAEENNTAYAEDLAWVYAEAEFNFTVNKTVWNSTLGWWDEQTNATLGSIVTFNITIENTGEQDIIDLEIYDYLPDGLIYVNSSATITPDWSDSYEVDWYFYNISMPSGAILYIEFDAEIVPSNDTYMYNWVEVWGYNESGGWRREDYAVVKLPQPTTNATIEKEVYNSNYWPHWMQYNYTYIGLIASFRITVTNTGIDTIYDYQVNDTISWGLSFYDCSPMYTSFIGNELMWLIPGPLYPGENVSIYLNLSVDGYGYQYNWAYLWAEENNTVYDMDSAWVYAGAEFNFSVQKTVWNSTIGWWDEQITSSVGSIVTFNITIENTDVDDIIDLEIYDYLPDGLIYVNGSATITPDWSDSYEVDWYFYNISMPSGAILYIEFDAEIVPSNDTYMYNWVQVWGYNESGGWRREDYAVVKLPQPTTNVAIEKEVYNWNHWNEYNYTYIGNQAFFRINVTNSGSDTIYEYQVNDTIPNGLSFYDCSPMYTSFVGNELMWIIPGPLYPSQREFIYLNFTIEKAGPFYNWAYVWAEENNSAYDSDSAYIFAEGEFNYSIQKTVWNSSIGWWDKQTSAAFGSTVTFNITIENTGEQDIIWFDIYDYLPAGLEYVNGSATVPVNQSTPSMVEWLLLNNTLAPGMFLYIEFDAEVVLDNQSFMENWVEAEVHNESMYLLRDDYAYVLLEQNNFGFQVEKMVWNNTLGWWDEWIVSDRGSIETFNITVFNDGETNLTAVYIFDYLPPGLEYVNGSANIAPWVSPTGDELQWIFEIGYNLTPGDAIYIEFDVEVVSGDGFEQWNWVNVTAYDSEMNSDTLEDPAVIYVNDVYMDMYFTKQVWNGTYGWVDYIESQVGNFETFRLRAINTGTESLYDVNITDYLPAGLVYDYANPVPSGMVFNMMYWLFPGEMLPGDNYTIYLDVEVVDNGTHLNWANAEGWNQTMMASVGGWDNATIEVSEIVYVELDPPFADYGVDNETDGRYNWLAVDVNFTIYEEGNYHLELNLFEGAWGFNYINSTWMENYYIPGYYTETLLINGHPIRGNEIEGPYWYDVIIDPMWTGDWGDDNQSWTQYYHWSEFQWYVELDPPFVDYGVDNETDGRYNWLAVDVNFTIYEEGDYHLHLNLMNGFWGPTINNTWIEKHYTPGYYTEKLLINGYSIRSNEIEGPYWYDVFIDPMWTGDWGDDNQSWTQYYHWSEFQWYVEMDPPFVDYGVDNETDGRYNWLAVDVNFTIYEEGDYHLHLNLMDGFWGPTINNTWIEKHYTPGYYTETLLINGYSIRSNEIEGPYWYDVFIDPMWTGDWGDDNQSWTQYYHWSEFQWYVELDPPFVDYGVDNETDGRYNWLAVDVNFTIYVAGNYHIFGALWDASLVDVINETWNEDYYTPGYYMYTLYFDGFKIRDYGADGPYFVDVILDYMDEPGMPENYLHFTQYYNWSDFQIFLQYSEITLEKQVQNVSMQWVEYITTQVSNFEAFRLVATNTGTESLIDVNVTDYLPAGLGYDYANPVPTWMGGGMLCWEFPGELLPGDNYTIYLDIEVIDNGTWENWASTQAWNLTMELVEDWDNATINASALVYVELDPPFVDYGVDVEPDGGYNWLAVDVNFTIYIEGNYRLDLVLHDAGPTVVTINSTERYYSAGYHTVTVYLDGFDILQNGIDGPYLCMILMFPTFTVVSEEVEFFWTHAYNYTDFQGMLVIRGYVSEPDGPPINPVLVEAMNGTYGIYNDTYNDVSGYYELIIYPLSLFTALDLLFSYEWGPGNWDVFWEDIIIAQSGTVVWYNATFTTICGYVWDPSGVPVWPVEVYADNWTYGQLFNTYNNETGYYEMFVCTFGDVTVDYMVNFVYDWGDGVDSFFDVFVEVTAGQRNWVNATFTTICGYVWDPSGTPIWPVEVFADNWTHMINFHTYNNETGYYEMFVPTFGDLTADYHMDFVYDWGDGIDSFFDVFVEVNASQKNWVNATFTTICGYVEDPSGTPIWPVEIYALNFTFVVSYHTWNNETGYYEMFICMFGEATANYSLFFGYEWEPGHMDSLFEVAIVTIAGQKNWVNATFTTICGYVWQSYANPMQHVEVNAYNDTYMWHFYNYSNPLGYYRIFVFVNGTTEYRLEFVDMQFAPYFVGDEWLDVIPSQNNWFNFTNATVDWIEVRDMPLGAGSQVLGGTVPIAFTQIGYAQAYNNSVGYLFDVSCDWTVDNLQGATSFTAPANNFNSTFNAGVTGGKAWWNATYEALQYSILWNILAPTADYIEIVDTPGSGINPYLDATLNVGDTFTGWVAGYNNTVGYIGDVFGNWSVYNLPTAMGTTDPTGDALSSMFDAGTVGGKVLWNATYLLPGPAEVLYRNNFSVNPIGVDWTNVPLGAGPGWDYFNGVGMSYVRNNNQSDNNATLLSPVFDCTGYGGVTVEFNNWYTTNVPGTSPGPLAGDIWGSIDGGATFPYHLIGWGDTFFMSYPLTLNLSWATGQSQVVLSFDIVNDGGGEWIIDNFFLNGSKLLKDSVTFDVRHPTVDYIEITDIPGGTPIPDQSMFVNTIIDGYASSYNNSIGYMGIVSVDWSIDTFGSASAFDWAISPSTNDTFDSGPTTPGYAHWNALFQGIFLDTVNITLRPHGVDHINITETPGGAEVFDMELPEDYWLKGYASAYNDTVGYLGTVIVNWTVENVASLAWNNNATGESDIFHSDLSEGTAYWNASIFFYSNWVNDSVVFTIFDPFVHNLDTGKGYKTIQEAIDDVETLDGHTLFVEARTYTENVVVHKSLTISGEDRDTTIVDAGGFNDSFWVTADSVTLEHFTAVNTGLNDRDAGVELDHVQYCQVSDVVTTGDLYGVYLYYSHNNTIDNVTSDGNNHAISLEESRDNVIEHCYLSNGQYGLYPRFSSDRNQLLNNEVDNFTYAVRLRDASNGVIMDNTILNSDYGFYNSFSNGNQIYHNNIIDNDVQAFDSGANTWDDGYPSGGNYWSDWTTPDSNADGFVDNPYDIGFGNLDNWPFARTNGWITNPLSAPMNLMITQGSATLTWDNGPQTGDWYYVFSSDTKDGFVYTTDPADYRAMLPTSVHTWVDSTANLSGVNTRYYVVRSWNASGFSPCSTMGLWHRFDFTYNSGLKNNNYIGLPYNWTGMTPYPGDNFASDIVTSIEGGTGGGTNSKLTVVGKWNPAIQGTDNYYYSAFPVPGWVGTNFKINPGDGINLVLSTTAGTFTWETAGTDFNTTQAFQYNSGLKNNNYIGCAWSTDLATASDIVTEIEGGTGGGTNTKLTVVGKWNPATQGTDNYYYSAFPVPGWVGTNFDIIPGDGINLVLVSTAGTFPWNTKVLTTPRPETYYSEIVVVK